MRILRPWNGEGLEADTAASLRELFDLNGVWVFKLDHGAGFDEDGFAVPSRRRFRCPFPHRITICTKERSFATTLAGSGTSAILWLVCRGGQARSDAGAAACGSGGVEACSAGQAADVHRIWRRH